MRESFTLAQLTEATNRLTGFGEGSAPLPHQGVELLGHAAPAKISVVRTVASQTSPFVGPATRNLFIALAWLGSSRRL